MFIKKIINSISNYKAMKRETLVDKFVKIHDFTTYGTSRQQLFQAKNTIANYAINKGVTIDVYSGSRISDNDKFASPVFENNLSENLFVKVTDLLNGKTCKKTISARTDKTYPHVKSGYIVIDDVKEGVQYKHEYEDNFLRHFYRTIEAMVNDLQK